MASHMARTSFIQAQRGLAAQAAVSAKKSETSAVKTTQLSNGLTVATMDTGARVSSVGFVIKAGSRNETYENLGVSHVLRSISHLATKDKSSFGIVRNIQQVGGKMDVTGGREYILYSAQLPRNGAGEVLSYVAAAVESPAFKSWEVADNFPRVKEEIDSLDQDQQVSELLHKAAFRDGLGNSIFSPDFMVGRHKPKMFADFHAKYFTTDRTILMGLDIDHDVLTSQGEAMNLPKSSGGSATSAPKFHAQELRHPSGGRATLVSIAAEAAPASNVKEAVANMLLQQILGTGPRVKYCTGQSVLQKATESVKGLHAVSAINYVYSDAGLMGAFIASEAEAVGEVVTNVVAALRSANITQKDLDRGKKIMQLYLDDQMASPAARLEAMAVHLAFGAKEAITPEQMAGLFSNASLSDVKAAAKKLSNANFAMASVGNLSHMPYLDQI